MRVDCGPGRRRYPYPSTASRTRHAIGCTRPEEAAAAVGRLSAAAAATRTSRRSVRDRPVARATRARRAVSDRDEEIPT